jgi:hypothetical protein
LHGGETTDLPCQLGIEIAARIVGDARQVDDGLNSGQIDFVDVADIATHDRQIGVFRQMISEPLDIEYHHVVAFGDELGHKHTALISAPTGYQDFH